MFIKIKQEIMKNTINTLLLILVAGLLASCGEMTNRVQDKLNELNNKAEHLEVLSFYTKHH